MNHLKLKLDDPATPKTENTPARLTPPALAVDAIAFNLGHLNSRLTPGSLVDIVASLDLNIWAGRSVPQLIVKEIFPIN